MTRAFTSEDQSLEPLQHEPGSSFYLCHRVKPANTFKPRLDAQLEESAQLGAQEQGCLLRRDRRPSVIPEHLSEESSGGRLGERGADIVNGLQWCTKGATSL